jgi:hypothetical protein
MAQFNLNPDPPPDCFGKSWNPRDVLCAGGADITFRDERTGSHVRPQCDFYSSCGARVAHTKMEQDRLMPAQSLVRSPTPATPAAPQAPAAPPAWMTPAQMQQWMNEQAKSLAAQMFQQMQQQYPQNGRSTAAVPYGSPPYPQGTPFYDPRFQPMPVNYQMPAYLTVPEQRNDGDSLLGVLFRTVFRSVMKAGGHSFSHFWDTMPMGRPYPPMPPPGG